MKIIINYTGEGIQPYSVEFEVNEKDLPKTTIDWQKLALGKTNLAPSKFIKDCTWHMAPNKTVLLQVEIDKRPEFLDIFPQELLPEITKHLIGIDEYTRVTKLTSKLFTQKISAAEEQVSGFAIFEQSPSTWFSFPDKVKEANKFLEDPKNIEKLLILINDWLQTDQGTERFFIWINTFRNQFLNIYNSLPTPRSTKHDALFALITADAEKLDLIQLNNTAETIAQNYPAVADSLKLTHAFLRRKNDWFTKPEDPYRDWRGNISFRGYFNLQGVGLSKAMLQRADLKNANLQSAELYFAVLLGADLKNANLQSAKLSLAMLQGAALQGANLRDANLQNAQLDEANLDDVLFDKNTCLDNCNLGGINVGRIKWPAELLLVAKEFTWVSLKEDINAANPANLIQIYDKNTKKNHIFDLKQNPISDESISSFFNSKKHNNLGKLYNNAISPYFISIKLNDYRKLFEDAICKRINELLQNPGTTQDEKEHLQQLEQTINPDFAASATNSLSI